jgi:hypothetical protein
VTAGKSVLIIGFEPTLLDYATIPDLDAAKVTAALKADEARLRGLGYEVELCLIDLGKTAETVVLDRLKQKQFNCILIGAGVRTIPEYFILFEKLINVVHEHAPQAKLCFNTKPSDTAEAVQRWV